MYICNCKYEEPELAASAPEPELAASAPEQPAPAAEQARGAASPASVGVVHS